MSEHRFRVRPGPLYMVLAGIVFTVMATLVKIARQDMDAISLIAWRGVFSLPIAFLLARSVGFRLHNRRLLVVRTLFGFGAMLCFFTAAKGISLADLSLLAKLQPIWLALLAPLLLGADERSSRLVWIVFAIGLMGTALILAPDVAVGSKYGLYAAGATVFSALAHLCIRVLGRTDKPATVVFWFQLGACVLAWTVYVVLEGVPVLPASHLWIYIVGCGVLATGGQVLMTKAYAIERASTVAAASYTAPLFAVIADLVAFSAVPTSATILGGVLLVGAGILLLRAPAASR